MEPRPSIQGAIAGGAATSTPRPNFQPCPSDPASCGTSGSIIAACPTAPTRRVPYFTQPMPGAGTRIRATSKRRHSAGYRSSRLFWIACPATAASYSHTSTPSSAPGPEPFMTDRTDGYVTDIGYTHGYYSELNPLQARL